MDLRLVIGVEHVLVKKRNVVNYRARRKLWIIIRILHDVLERFVPRRERVDVLFVAITGGGHLLREGGAFVDFRGLKGLFVSAVEKTDGHLLNRRRIDAWGRFLMATACKEQERD
jgi:hypothetical protein